MAAIINAYERFLVLLAVLVGIMVLASMVFVVVDVLLRYFFGAPIGWVIEVCEYFLLFTPFLGMAWLVRQAEGHIRIDVLVQGLSARLQAVFNCWGSLLIGVTLVFGAYYSAISAWGHVVRNVQTPGVYPIPKRVSDVRDHPRVHADRHRIPAQSAWALQRSTILVTPAREGEIGDSAKHARAPYAGYNRDHARPCEDDELTYVGPGTPCGEYFRRFWLPVAKSSELADAPLRLRILGEDLVLFRDGSGDIGLLELHCAHRGTSLEFGKIAVHGIRCCYHGWHYAIDGRILDTPTHNERNTPKDRIYQGAYPVRDYEGLVFAYMGPPDRQPAFPIYDVHLQPGVTHLVDKFPSPCNWLQIRENGVDPIHSVFLHAGHHFPETLTEFPVLAFEETPIGIAVLAARRVGDMVYLRQNEIFLPTANWVNGLEDGKGETVFDRRGGMIDWVVPVDDTNSYTFKMYDVYDADNQPPSGMDGIMDRERSAAGGFSDAVAQTESGQTGDRAYAERQRSPGDWDAWTSQGTIHGHESENLGITDAGVIRLRNLIRRDIGRVRNGEDPTGVIFEADATIRTHVHNTVVRVPKAPTREQDRKLCRALQRAFFDQILAGALHRDLPVAEKLKMARGIVATLAGT